MIFFLRRGVQKTLLADVKSRHFDTISSRVMGEAEGIVGNLRALKRKRRVLGGRGCPRWRAFYEFAFCAEHSASGPRSVARLLR